ncbi:MAG: efflux RND transporter periplasmic adaptor subunit [Pseudomonadota bacterium]
MIAKYWLTGPGRGTGNKPAAPILVMAVLTLVLSLSGCGQQVVSAPADQTVRPARIFVVQSDVDTWRHEFVGRVEAAQSIDVSFEVSGPLAELPVLEGQTIQRGELVAALEATDFELAVREAEVELQLARQDLQRKRQVLAQKGIARSVVDDALSIYQLQQVRLDKAAQSLRETRIVAPFDAYVARRFVDNFVNVGVGEKIARLNDLHSLLVVANVPENLLATVNEDQVLSIRAHFDFIPDESFALVYKENRGEADSVAQTYEVSMQMQRPSRWNILPGMTARVELDLRQAGDASVSSLIPASALVAGADNSFFVWRFNPDTLEVTRMPVTVGAPKADGVEITNGLVDGDLIVATGASQLQPGMRVSMLGEPSTRL